MSFRPKTAQAQRPNGQESSIPIPRTKSIPLLRRPPPPPLPPLPLGPSKSQSQIPPPRTRHVISRKPSIPLRSGIPLPQAQVQAQVGVGVGRKGSSNRLKSPTLLPLQKVRERKPLPTRSILPTTSTSTTSVNTTGSKRAPSSPSIDSVPIVNRLNRKASVPILPRAGYLTRPTGSRLDHGKGNGNLKVDQDEGDIFKGGQSIIENPHSKPASKEAETRNKQGIQKMMLRGTIIERLDYLENGVELEDMSIDLIGTPSPTKPNKRRTSPPPPQPAMPSINHQQTRRHGTASNEHNSHPTTQDSNPQFPFKIPHSSSSFSFNSPIRPPRSSDPMPMPTPLLPRWPSNHGPGRGYVVDIDEMSMLAEESFGFTGDSIEFPTPSSGHTSIPSCDQGADGGKDNERSVVDDEVIRIKEIDQQQKEEEMRMIEGRMKTITLERDHAIAQEVKGKVELKERKCKEIQSRIELEIERCEEYRDWLVVLRGLIPERGGSGLK